MPNQSNFSAKSYPASTPDGQNDSDSVCGLLQQIGLPAVRIAPGTAEVLSFNELFPSLIDTSALSDRRLWFVEGVVRYFSPADRDRWEVALSSRAPTEIHAQLKSPGNQPVDVLMRVAAGASLQPADRSMICIFMPLIGPYFERLRQTWTSEGQQSERKRIRTALHKEVAQQFLGAAFGCKLMADELATVDERLGKQASDLAELLSQATQGLHNVINPPD
ncbi:MAG TPA: hypothetical protein VE242_14005 [Chthoniobacterales bacterium]|nr:hypothetical protein [Chthoniobacterales bacterium]